MRKKPIYLIKTITIFTIGLIAFLYIQNNNITRVPEEELNEVYLLLLENRLSYIQITKLIPTDTTFNQNYADLRAKIRTTNNMLTDSIKSDPQDSVLDSTKTLEALSRQLHLLDTLDAQESFITQLFSYDPLIDLGSLSITENSTTILERVNSTILGINRNAQSASTALPTIHTDVQPALQSLTKLKDALQAGNVENIASMLSVAITDYNKLKETLFEKQLTIIRSAEAIEVLTEMTNILIDVRNTLNSSE